MEPTEDKPPVSVAGVPEPGSIELKEVKGQSIQKDVTEMNQDEVREELVLLMVSKYAPRDPTLLPPDQHNAFELAKQECRELIYEWEAAGIKNFPQMLHNARETGGTVQLVHDPETAVENLEDIPDTDLRVCVLV